MYGTMVRGLGEVRGQLFDRGLKEGRPVLEFSNERFEALIDELVFMKAIKERPTGQSRVIVEFDDGLDIEVWGKS